MQIIAISRGTFSGGRELADLVAKKLDCPCLSREEVIEEATREGIQVGKLEMAMVKPGIFSEKLALERDHYLAFSTLKLCEKAISGRMVYHGRTGNFLLPNVGHVLRVRVLADREYRIKSVMQNLGLTREKAQIYIDQVDEDRRRWVHSMYGISWEDAANYDIVINLARMSLGNAASALVNMAQLPDFQMTPASKRAMEELMLGSKARILLAKDSRTYHANVKVRADNGTVTVTYMPQDTKIAEVIPEVCKNLPGAREIRATMAMTNILWIQEIFDPVSKFFKEVVEIATKWNAAVELVKLSPEDNGLPGKDEISDKTAESNIIEEHNGGIEEDIPDISDEEGNLKNTLDELARIGKSGGGRVVHGGQRRLLDTLGRGIPYSLVVIGDVFMAKGHSARLRATRDLRSFLSDHIKAPVVTADELESQYLFGKKDILHLLLFICSAVVIYFLVFSNQNYILEFLAQEGWFKNVINDSFLSQAAWIPKMILSIAIFLFVPVIAYCYGTATRLFLKMMKME